MLGQTEIHFGGQIHPPPGRGIEPRIQFLIGREVVGLDQQPREEAFQHLLFGQPPLLLGHLGGVGACRPRRLPAFAIADPGSGRTTSGHIP